MTECNKRITDSNFYSIVCCILTVLAFLQRARVRCGISSNDVEDAQQLQDVLHPTGILATARLCLCSFSSYAKDLTALIG